MQAKVVLHRRANDMLKYLETKKGYIAEGDLVKINPSTPRLKKQNALRVDTEHDRSINGELYMFHPGGFFTIFMTWPLIYFFQLTWRFWKQFALAYKRLLYASATFQIPIILELKNVKADDIDELPASLVHIDTYDLELARAMKKKFNCRVSIHLLWCAEDGGLIFKDKDGYFVWRAWDELDGIDVITPTFHLSSVRRHGPKLWKRVKERSRKTVFLGGGFRNDRNWEYMNPKFEASIPFVDGWYLRRKG